MFKLKVIRKAVFPVAGLGTRFLPATKSSPKEMLPIVDIYNQHHCSILGVEQVPHETVDRYGIVESAPIAER